MQTQTRQFTAGLCLRPSRKFGWFKGGQIASVGLLVVALLADIGDARAFDFLGIHLFGDKSDETPSPDAQPYTIDLTVQNADQTLTDSVKAASHLWSDREGKAPPSTPAFLAKANAEYAAIVGALRSAGYYGGSISILVDGKPLQRLTADATLPHPVPVKITVDAGPIFRFGRIDIAGRPPELTDLRARTETGSPEGVGLVAGTVARSDVILKAEATLLASWRQQGHPKVKALPHVIVAHFNNDTLDVSIGADPGPMATFGAVRVEGTKDMDPAYVARQTDITPGEPWDEAKVEEASRRLRALQVFSSVVFKQDPVLGPDGALGLTSTVAERPKHVYGADASYSTLDGLGVGGFWQHRNLFGHAENLKLEAGVSGIDSKDPRKYSYRVGATLLMPGALGPDLDVIAKVIGERQVLDPYSENTVTAQLGVSKHFSRYLIGTVMASGQLVHASDGFGNRNMAFLSLPISLAYDGSDDKLEPSAGWRGSIALEPFYETHFGNAGVITKVSASDYYAIDAAKRYVLAGRVAVGSIVGAPAYQLPPDRLFFAGGGQSVRGYAYRSLGPRLANGVTVGGLSTFETSFEVRAKVTETIGVVPFVDAGSAFKSELPDFKEQLQVGAGLGLRYYTSLGALRLDVAAPVNPRRNDPKFAIYLGLGESF
jgi:translocation and assembly module TamA